MTGQFYLSTNSSWLERVNSYFAWKKNLSNLFFNKFFLGFYYLNNSDQVKCIECGGVIGRWEEGDVPFIEHRKFFPDCPIVCQNDLSNEEIGIQTVKTPKYPSYSTIESRVRSFSTWTSVAQDPSVLSQAGFFYLGSGDEVSNCVINQ